MTAKPKMTPEEEYEFFARAENQVPQGQPRRRRARLTEMVPVRFAPETLAEVQRRAGEDDRSVSSWIRRAVEHELAIEPTAVSGLVSAPPTSRRRQAPTGADERGAEGVADQELPPTGADTRPQAHTRRKLRPPTS